MFFVINNITYLIKITKLLVKLALETGHYLADNKKYITFAAA